VQESGYTCGGNIEVALDGVTLVISTPVKYHPAGSKPPAKHQLLLTFEDGSMMSCTVQMWGAMLCLPNEGETLSQMRDGKPSPLSDAFNEEYFNELHEGLKPNLSAKAFLATEQRIPGLGNGVLHDILFNAQIHPKRKLETLSKYDFKRLFNSVKETLKAMTEQGGRDTEKDLFGQWGGYPTVLSSKTLKFPCRTCGGWLSREAYLGGNIYFCPGCQPLG
jgi:formamidopyrimidine-DNA glycosylase